MTTPTTTLTFADLIAQYDDELTDLRDAYDELTEWITEEFGPDATEWSPQAMEDLSDDRLERLATVQATRQAYNESGKAIQQRQHALESLRSEYGGDYEIRMLTGQETIDIAMDLRMEAQSRGVDQQLLQDQRKGLVVDAATVAAPDAVPTNDDGPTPSECPNPLMRALYEQVERLNDGGTTDFRAPGFGDGDTTGPASTSAVPTSSATASRPSPPTGTDSGPSGDS